MEKLFTTLVWNSFIRIILETYFQVLFTAMVNLVYEHWDIGMSISDKYSA